MHFNNFFAFSYMHYMLNSYQERQITPADGAAAYFLGANKNFFILVISIITYILCLTFNDIFSIPQHKVRFYSRCAGIHARFTSRGY